MMITEKAKLNVWSNKEVEMFKKEYFIDYNTVAYASSELAKKENNDCVVKAFMVALNISYVPNNTWYNYGFYILPQCQPKR